MEKKPAKPESKEPQELKEIKELKEHHKSSKKHGHHRKNSSESAKVSRSRSRSHSHKHKSSKTHKKQNKSRSISREKSKKTVLKEVEVGKIYDGRVTKVHDYGCFVLLENFMPKKEGLVHISNIRDKRITNAFEAVQRNQNVKVKVIGIAGSKISLSMKEVDQQTGEEIEKKPKSNRLPQVSYILYSILLKFTHFYRMMDQQAKILKKNVCLES